MCVLQDLVGAEEKVTRWSSLLFLTLTRLFFGTYEKEEYVRRRWRGSFFTDIRDEYDVN